MDWNARKRQELKDVRRVDDAKNLIQRRNYDDAIAVLEDVRSRTPAHYPFEERSGRELLVRCWSMPEYLDYEAELRATSGHSRAIDEPEICWLGEAYARAAWLLAYIAVEKKDYEAALRYTEEGLALQPHAGRLVKERAHALNELSRFEECVQLCTDALASGAVRLDRDRASILRSRSYAQMELDDLEGAEESLNESLMLQPGNGTALRELEYLKELWAQRATILAVLASGPGMSQHHAMFALDLLPALLRQCDGVLGVLANLNNQEFPATQWDSLNDRLAPGACVSSAGLRNASYWLGGAHLVIALHLPPPPPGAAETFSDIVITTSPRIRYFTWEQRFGNGNSLIEVLDTGDVEDHGPVGGADHFALLHATCRMLGVAECIEAPLLPQTFGTARSEPMYLPHVRRAAGEDARRIAELMAEASAALNSQDHLNAVTLYTALLALRLAVEGPENPDATEVHMHLARAQAAAGDLAAAERTCQAWWAMCRRHFPLGSPPTSRAIFELASWVKKQGRRDEALHLLRYRAQLAGLAHGANSLSAVVARDGAKHVDFW